MSLTLNDVKAEFKLDDWKYDPWGTATEWLFQICFTLAVRDESAIPESWGYTCGLAGHESPTFEWLSEVDTATLVKFGNILGRYRTLAEAAGKSY